MKLLLAAAGAMFLLSGCAGHPDHFYVLSTQPGGAGQAKRLPLPVEAEDLQLDPEVHLAQGHLRGDAHRRGSKVDPFGQSHRTDLGLKSRGRRWTRCEGSVAVEVAVGAACRRSPDRPTAAPLQR